MAMIICYAYAKFNNMVVSGRTIRTLAPAQTRASSSLPKALAPPAKTNHFLARSLNLRGDAANSKLRGWERRAGEYSSLLL